ncbi:Pc13g07810 [Penicillium rubens Wisconsin 54-1255]|uniref:Pc13g07810 protein n=1 Tax=Penicillium rubens (strain ATCC 28089 / DSM 1075 / NRRL 1951 / Wisconsin 54-1255) TaxID=500485 RepID=B6H469_PENRW|nr:Pc13g07810 [Penicillium rubens Wisconsin 54-1255]
MSSLYGSQQWPELLPPQSAQPRPSLFGGPSSDGLQPSSQPEPPRSSLFGGPFEQDLPLEPFSEDPMDEEPDQNENEFDTLMREQPLAFPDDSDDESYQENNRGRSRTRSKRTQKPQHEPIYYVVDRGLDLPPGVERPNLFDGHATSWRNYNADDIGAYNAMITHRTRDLAAHLYNAHVIRRRARDTARKSHGVVDQAPLRVHKWWAAWPVHAATVPRPNELIQRTMDAPDNFQMQPDPRPSAELEECITAFILKTSKETFQAREWTFEEIEDNSRNKMDGEDELMDDELEKKEEDEEEEEAPVDTRILRPTVLLDDDRSLRQLRPLARNVISQVDRLLYGLHCAMKGRKFEEDSGDEQWGDSDEEDYPVRENRQRGSRSRSRGRRSARQESRERELSRRSNSVRISTGLDTENESLPEVSQTRAQSRGSSASRDNSRHTKGRLRLRDWSEVMGLASMMGLPAPAVMRASKRCADLFGEDMEFRIMPEGRVRKKRKADAREEYVYTESESDNDSAPPSPQPSPVPIPQPSHRPEPIPELEPKPRVNMPKPKAKTPKSKEKTPKSKARAPEQAVDEEARTVKPGVGKGAHRKADILCPVRSCTRHTNGFSRKWNLNQHLKKAHGIHVAPGNEASIERDDPVIRIE